MATANEPTTTVRNGALNIQLPRIDVRTLLPGTLRRWRRYSLPSGPHPYMDTEVRSIHWPADSLITSDAYTRPASSYDSTHARITFFSLITLSDAFEGSRLESANIARRPSGSGDSDNSLVPASPDSAGHFVTSTQTNSVDQVSRATSVSSSAISGASTAGGQSFGSRTSKISYLS